MKNILLKTKISLICDLGQGSFSDLIVSSPQYFSNYSTEVVFHGYMENYRISVVHISLQLLFQFYKRLTNIPGQ